MDFIRAIVNESDLITDEEVNNFWAEVQELEDADQLDEDAFDRIAKRVENRNIINYRLIVGAENLMRVRLFLELAKEGKNIPSAYVKGMQPAIEMLDDIVSAGPGFVQLLRVLHKRAQKKQ